MKVLTISQINFFLKSLIEGDGRLTDIYAVGEISNFTNHYRSGHLYFSLKDDKAAMKTVMFASAARRLRFQPKDGMRVIVRCRVSVYEASGQVQMYVEEMQPDGLGALSLAFEQMKEKLSKEGLFSEEFKKPLPRFPKCVGLVTSPTGAAVEDMKNILSRRWPSARLVLCPVLVQGEGAAKQLAAAVARMNAAQEADVLIIGRGGGSAEDLAAFNDEGLARAVFASRIPVISAVGHETDFTICDFVADLRAPTPSAAAELAVPDRAELLIQLQSYGGRMEQAARRRVEERRMALDALCLKPVLRKPQALLDSRRSALETAVRGFKTAAESRLGRDREALKIISGRLDAMSPLKVLSRGYAILSHKDGRVLRTVGEAAENETLYARLSDGVLRLTVRGCAEDISERTDKNG